MFLTVTEDAQNKLLPFGNDESVILLDMNDGVGEYSKVGVCSLDTSFRFLILTKSQPMADYDEVLDSTVGPIPIKGYSRRYLDEAMTLELDKRLQVLKLKGEGGQIDGSVEIVDLRTADVG